MDKFTISNYILNCIIKLTVEPTIRWRNSESLSFIALDIFMFQNVFCLTLMISFKRAHELSNDNLICLKSLSFNSFFLNHFCTA